MSADFHQLELWATSMLAALGPAGRRRLAVRLAMDLRRSQSARIAAQRNPDGSSYEGRKPEAPRFRARNNKIRARAAARKDSQPMFRKLRTAAFLKGGADGQGAWVGFTGRAARIAAVHQDGGVDQVYPDGPRVRYAMRQLLGFTDEERQQILDRLFQAVDL